MSRSRSTSRNRGQTDSLTSMLQESQIEWPPEGNSRFIPIDVIGKLEEKRPVRRELRRIFPGIDRASLDHYVHIICTKATKIFAILLAISIKIQVIRELLDEGITDANLPFVRVPLYDVETKRRSSNYTLGKHEHKNCQTEGHAGCGIMALSNWRSADVRHLDRDQWLALSPFFKRASKKVPHYHFEDNTILPFTEDDENRKGKMMYGGYSEVWAVRIHPAHQDILISSDHSEPAPLIAVKRLYSREQQDFDKERYMLTFLTLKHHPHLVKLLTTYTYKGRFHLLCPYANANLRTYWGSNSPKKDWSNYYWSLKQMAGLASALNEIHNFKTDHYPLHSDSIDPLVSDKRPSMPRKLNVLPGEELFGRHGDLKPENILWSKNSDSHGILQIADLGLGRFHRLESRSKQDPSKINGSPTYMPPELPLGKLISRAYDIWSLGCIFLEFATWVLLGPEGLSEFGDARMAMAHDGVMDDSFYTLFNSGPGYQYGEVREEVKDWITKLHQCNTSSEIVRDVLDLVEKQMLQVKVEDRISAQKLHDFFTAKLQGGKNDRHYLLRDS